MSGPEGWLRVEITLYVNPTADGIERHEIITPGSGGTLRVWLTPAEFEGRFGVPMPRPPRVGPLGLSEADTRWVAGLTANDLRVCSTTSHRMAEALQPACRAAVAEWDAGGDR